MAKPRRRHGSGRGPTVTLAVAVLLASLFAAPAAADPKTEPATAEKVEARQTAGAIEVIEDVPPRVIASSQKAPVYPPAAQAARFTGTVKLKATVKEDGSVGDVEILECDHTNVGFEAAAIEAVKKWRFEPGTKDGAPAETVASFRLNFRSGGPGTGFQAFSTGMSGVNSEAGAAKTSATSGTQNSSSSSSNSSSGDNKKD